MVEEPWSSKQANDEVFKAPHNPEAGIIVAQVHLSFMVRHIFSRRINPPLHATAHGGSFKH